MTKEKYNDRYQYIICENEQKSQLCYTNDDTIKNNYTI